MTEGERSARRIPAGSPPRALALVRVGLGVVWALNLIFILDPANQFFSSFSDTAQSYAPTTLGGPALATFVSSQGDLFSAAIAATTAYLAVAFLIGLTTRLAALVGLAFNASLLISQFGSIVVIPGGTDVGPMPLYLVLYLALLAAGGPTLLSVDGWWLRRPDDTASEGRPESLDRLRRSWRWAWSVARRPARVTSADVGLSGLPRGRPRSAAEKTNL
ncbi:MAG: hypothetical protein L3K17_00490 [Thermoplasmata archaeon]|nr:hypothetical protein [Thermoplasmata archaeon]